MLEVRARRKIEICVLKEGRERELSGGRRKSDLETRFVVVHLNEDEGRIKKGEKNVQVHTHMHMHMHTRFRYSPASCTSDKNIERRIRMVSFNFHAVMYRYCRWCVRVLVCVCMCIRGMLELCELYIVVVGILKKFGRMKIVMVCWLN